MKVGDRVRVNCPGSEVHGREATIVDIQICRLRQVDGSVIGPVRSYFVDVDGIGTIHPTCHRGIAYERHELIPITKPKAGSWDVINSKLGFDMRIKRQELPSNVFSIEFNDEWEETFKGTDFDIRRERVRIS